MVGPHYNLLAWKSAMALVKKVGSLDYSVGKLLVRELSVSPCYALSERVRKSPREGPYIQVRGTTPPFSLREKGRG